MGEAGRNVGQGRQAGRRNEGGQGQHFNADRLVTSYVETAFQVIEGQTEVTRRCKELLDDLGDRRGCSHLKEEALDHIKWRNRFGRGSGPVV